MEYIFHRLFFMVKCINMEVKMIMYNYKEKYLYLKKNKIGRIFFVILFLLLFLMVSMNSIKANDVMRIEGKDRYITSVEISKKINTDKASIVLVNGDNYIDALSGNTLASTTNGRILLVKKDKIPRVVEDEINRVKPDIIYILGGMNSIEKSIEKKLENLGINVKRISGYNRYRTSEKVVQEVISMKNIEKLAIASNESDIICAAQYCGEDIPIILVEENENSIDFINSLNLQEKIVFGGNKSISQSFYNSVSATNRIFGKNRYVTSVEIAKLKTSKSAYIVSGENLVDALSLGPLAYQNDRNIIFSKKYGLPSSIRDFVKSTYYNYDIVGGKNWVPDDIMKIKKPDDLNNDKVANTSKFEYWDKYNNYDRKVILNSSEIEKINKKNISKSNYLYKVENIDGEYGVISRRAIMKKQPYNGKDPDTFDDYTALTGLFPWEEVVIRKYNADKSWAFVYSVDYYGWIPTKNIMKMSKSQMLENRNKKFVVFTDRQYKTSEGDIIDMGTKLPLVKSDSNYYTVEMPIHGNYYKTRYILIPKTKATEGYLEFSQANIIKQALKFKGEKYGWGHSNLTRDCSGFVRDTFKTFGIIIPRDSSSQEIEDIGKKVSFKGINGRTKRENLMMSNSAGSLLYLPGHVFMYIGINENSKPMIMHHYGYVFENGVKKNHFRSDITSPNLLTTKNGSFLDYVTTLRNFQVLK